MKRCARITALALLVSVITAFDAAAQSGIVANPSPPADPPPAPSAPRLDRQPLTGHHDSPVMDNEIYAHGLLEQFENRTTGPSNAFRYEGQAWVGTDYNRVWLRSEGMVRDNGTFEEAQHQLLYSRAISTYFDLQGGLRYDIDSAPSRAWAAVGVQGLALYFFELAVHGYMSDGGHLAARLEGSYDLPITQRLILQPRGELNFYSKDDGSRRIGSGLSNVELGLRLRYEITRKFAPYIGVSYEEKVGNTGRFAVRDGEASQEVRFVFGLRAWF